MAYRSASTVFPGSYALYGYGDSYNGNFSALFTPQIISQAGDSTLLDLFGMNRSGSDETEEGTAFTAPTASSGPQLTAETPLGSSNYPLLAADVSVPKANVAYGGYTATDLIGVASSDFVYHLFIPE